MSEDQKNYIWLNEMDLKAKQRVMNQLDLSEVVHIAYTGSQSESNWRQFDAWRHKKISELNPLFKQGTVWDRIKGSGRV